MSSPATRFLLVDDTDSGIQYTGPWFSVAQGGEDSFGSYGAPFLGTLMGVNSSASLSYTFSGSQVSLYGSSQDSATLTKAKWQCFIDGINVGRFEQEFYPGNNRVFCNVTTLQDGKHTISLNVTSTTTSVFFDHINGWREGVSGILNYTQQPGAVMSFSFFGTSLAWYSIITSVFSANSTAAYSLNEQPPLEFALAGLPPGSTGTFFNQQFFQTRGLPTGQHSIVVTNGAGSSNATTPLSLDFLIIQNVTRPSPSSTSTSASFSPTAVASPNTNSKSKSPVGAAVGGTLGGIVGVILIIYFFNNFIRKKKYTAIAPFHVLPWAATSPTRMDGTDTPTDR
ncbi:hypothetical protein GALMADRAFT_1328582 [Galerina marginata CBS 339.88]|uniref:Transmembrane protein n=1 Tax=Galerina marginata (strain CBS 339.88) TaxID=685588 RepID=A0A067TCF1_GALM3|nr:hypothetical protein GALMADRAFT_1328582 [Galerina marginata CBS 339.88]